MNRPYFCRKFFLTDCRHKRLKNRSIDLLLFYGEHFYGIWESEHLRIFSNLHYYTDNEVSNFYSRLLTNQKLESVIRICQWNCCQFFSEKLLLGTMIIFSVKALCILDEKTFMKNFMQTTLL